LIGSHGGMGGEQTDAFMLHPGDMAVSATTNSADVYHILNARRDTPADKIAPKKKTLVPVVDAWTPSTWLAGLRQVPVWLGRMLRAMALDRKAYQEVAGDAYMTGPALLIGIVGMAISGYILAKQPTVFSVGGRVVFWPLVALLLQATARLLGGKGTYTATFRVMGFAYGAYLIGLLAFIPVVGPLAKLIAAIISFLGVWIGTTQAHQLRGWRTLILPVLYIIVVAVVAVLLDVLLMGAVVSFESLFTALGM
jgi:hypothetical protein